MRTPSLPVPAAGHVGKVGPVQAPWPPEPGGLEEEQVK